MNKSSIVRALSGIAVITLGCGCSFHSGGFSFSFSWANTWEQKTETIRKSSAGIETLSISTPSGSIQVIGEDDASEIEATITVRAGSISSAHAYECLEYMIVEPQEHGTALHIELDWADGKPHNCSGSVSYRVAAPRELIVKAHTDYGNIEVRNAKRIEANTSSGDIRSTNIAESCDIKSSYGRLDINGVQGAVVAETSSGAIQAFNLAGRTKLKSSYGNIDVSRSKCEISAHTSSGSITADGIEGPTTLRTGYGNIVARDVEGAIIAETNSGRVEVIGGQGYCDLDSDYGRIEVRDREGDISAHASSGRVDVAVVASNVSLRSLYGSISADLRYCNTLNGEIHTSSGAIELLLGEGVSTTLKCNTSSGRVNTRGGLRLYDTQTRRDSLAAKLGDAQGTLRVRSDYGSITVGP